MRINLASVFVDDQRTALEFYTAVLGFQKKTDVPVGEYAWLTVVSPDQPDGVELVLEPSQHPAVGPFKAALVHDGIPFTSFAVDDVAAEQRTPGGARRALHPAAHRHGTGDDRGLRRHVRQPDPDHQPARHLTIPA